MGFEPTRAEPIGLAVQRLNHSATSSVDNQLQWKYFKYKFCFHIKNKKVFPTPGVEPGPAG